MKLISLPSALLGFLMGALVIMGVQHYRSGPDTMELLSAPGHEQLKLPFSEGVRVGNMIYLSGQIGAKPGKLELVGGGIQAETRQTLENIRNTLERHGSSLDRVVKCTVFLARMEDWPAMNEAYVAMFGDHRPARSALGVNGLALNGSLEMECLALANP